MKNITKFIFMAFAAAWALTACSPDNNFLLGDSTVTADQVSFTYAKSATNDNIIQFTNTSTVKILTASVWDLGNGVTSRDKNPRGMYPEAGDYKVTLTVISTDGTSVATSQTVHIAKDDPTLYDTPTYNNLTGGAGNTDGRTWVLDQWNSYTAEVKDKTGINITGHLGSGPVDAAGPDWWNAGPNEKSIWKIYDFKFTFSMIGGLKLHVVSGGEGYAPVSFNGSLPFPTTFTDQYDMGFAYDGGDYTFTINEAQYPVLTLSANAFMAYYPGTQAYEIVYLTDKVMALRARGGDTRTYVFIREDLNIEPASINDDQVTFIMTKGSDEFTYNYSVNVVNPNNAVFTTQIQFGDGESSTELSGNHEYIVPAGTYTARCVVTAGVKTITKEQTVVIANDNPKYKPTSFAGLANTWVIDANNKHVSEVASATGKDIRGFIGLNALNSYSQTWWGAGPQDKSYDNTLASVGHGWTLYDWKITMTTEGGFNIVTAGEGYGRAALDGNPFTSTWKNSDDMAFEFNGGNYTYTVVDGSPYPKMTLSGNAFFGYYVGTQEYEIMYLSDTALCIVAHNTAEGQDWVFILCPDGEQ